MKKFFIFYFFLFFISNLYSINLEEEVKTKKIPVYSIKNVQYISLKSLFRIINCDNWAKIEDRVFIFFDDTQIKFKIDDVNVIYGGKNYEIKNPVKEIEGEILVPLQDFSYLLSEYKVVPKKDVEKEEKREKIENKRFVIVIDPGHGGHDAGAIGNYGLKEKDVNLDVAIRLEKFLKKQLLDTSVEIYLTRKDDVFISLEDRVNIAKSLNADILFSIHTNSSRFNRENASGFETYYPYSKVETNILPKATDGEGILKDENNDILSQIINNLNETDVIDESRILAEIVQEKLAERLITPDRGAKRGNFYVLKYTPMISVLTEIGFICNPLIEFNLKDVEVRQAIAETLGKAIIEYLKKREILK
ncbi:MAG: N-acetylmuramoyl-L-alanine amidase [Candidatus Ratteibacteria bacterium]